MIEIRLLSSERANSYICSSKSDYASFASKGFLNGGLLLFARLINHHLLAANGGGAVGNQPVRVPVRISKTSKGVSGQLSLTFLLILSSIKTGSRL